MEKDLGKRIEEITEALDDDMIKSASNEELMGYLFLVEKMKLKLKKAFNMKEGE